MKITKEFRFDAAHFLPTAPKGHPNSRMHGHSFTVAVTLAGRLDPAAGWVRSFADVDEQIAQLRARLDHHVLNEIKGLELPTLEHIAVYVFDDLKARLPELSSVTVRRDSLGESCTYQRDA